MTSPHLTNSPSSIDPKTIRIRSIFPCICDSGSTLQFLKALWPSHDQKYQIGTLDRQAKKFRNIPVNSIDEADQLAHKLSAEGSDAYFAIAGYETSANRTSANSSGAVCFWMDLDCSDDKAAMGKGYLTTQYAEQAILKFSTTIQIPAPTYVLDSGGGLHVYWVFDQFLPRDPWLAYAKKLKALAHAHGLLADPTRTADIASVLRIPGTLNYKYDPPRPVTIRHASDAQIHTQTMLDAITKAYKGLPGDAEGQCQTGTNQAATISRKFSNNSSDSSNSNWSISRLATLLKEVDPEEGGRPAWIAIGMALHNVTGGGDKGLELFDQWSKCGATYPGRRAIEVQWSSFNSSSEIRHNIGTIINRVKATCCDWMTICSATDDPFEPCESEVIGSIPSALEKTSATPVQAGTINPLDSFSLLGMSEEIARDAQGQKPILGGLAILGQATAIFAPPNSGKTLITINNICEDIRQRKVESSKVYYVNVDDSAQGLANKLALADEFGFHILSEGYREFNASDLLRIMEEMVAASQAKDVIVILDTIKKFTNLMDKTKASQFTKIIRQFVMKGGTVIGMAHTNKKLGANGKPIYGGTSDLVDDFDCAYTIATKESSSPTEKIVVFDNIKRRGSNPIKVAYRYSIDSELNYNEILMSVERVDDEQLTKVAQVAKSKSDADVIASILACITQGINTKMVLAGEVAKEASISKRQALTVIERYTGNDPAMHKWSFTVRDRGAKVFALLNNINPPKPTTLA
ncbi:PriCT-2 domain-containing protein [Dechloromonas denitrificans]|uniref:PriCT-2 domain-containing protein n=1 Tax=Dechloromonas denitrificans TaxID=281362 RepID=UPI001CFA13CD|nr:PriCT-2 domain-containing protein [Dechloromonas denitrificans]UCV07208.1 PriCT-2 domain-containing protein [Dechloromonas denitrificans]